MRGTISAMAPTESQTAPRAPSPKAHKAPKSGAAVVPARKRVDWEAVERDFRTGSFSKRELSDKHGLDPATLSRKIKADQTEDPDRWKADLKSLVRQATSAKVMAAMVRAKVNEDLKMEATAEVNSEVNSMVKEYQTEVNSTIQIAAEVNTNVILKHRSDIEHTRKVAADLLAEVSTARLMSKERDLLAKILAGDKDAQALKDAHQVVRKALDFSNRVASVKSLAETFTKLQTAERVAFSLDDNPAEKVDHEAERYARMSITERAARLALIFEKARKKAEAAGDSP